MNIGIVTTWFSAGGGYVSKAYWNILSKDNNVLIRLYGNKDFITFSKLIKSLDKISFVNY